MEEINSHYCRRDKLAIERTHLANERTLLSYWRTALAFLVLGGFLIRQSSASNFYPSAFIAIIIGIFLFIYGTFRFYRFKKIINHQ